MRLVAVEQPSNEAAMPSRSIMIIAALAALASCGSGSNASNQAQGGNAVENATQRRLTLTSDAFHNGQPIPTVYSCDGANHSPAISWNEPPAGTKSFALVIDDPDAPKGTFRHWGVYNIPASARGIDQGQHIGTEVNNDGGKPGYTGPCPPKGNGVHHYHFKLFALGVDRLDLSGDAKVADVEAAASSHAIAQGELIGTYERR
jgi:Raf kinase inhibitor-like YbhB/YbcL family protein